MSNSRYLFLGVPFDNVATADVLAAADVAMTTAGAAAQVAMVGADAVASTRLRIEGLNVAKLVSARRVGPLRQALEEAELVHVDGAGVALGLALCGLRPHRRRAGIDLMHDLLDLAARRGHPVYFLGARREVLERALERVRERLPGLRIAGWSDGYFREDGGSDLVRRIRESGARLLLVGISSPKKELFIQRHWSALGVCVAMGVGGSFDVLGGAIRRAPVWMQRSGLEWLFRLSQEPRRLFWRYTLTNSTFALLLLSTMLRQSERPRLVTRSGPALH